MRSKIILIIFSFLCFTNCISKKNSFNNQNFEYVNGKEKIIFEISTGNKYLQINTPTLTKFNFQNIDPKVVSIAGKGIKFLKNSDNPQELLIEMFPKIEDLQDDKFAIVFSYRNNGKFNIYKLIIPVKW